MSNEQIWPSVFMLLCLVLLTLIKVNALPKVVRIIQSTFSTQVLQQLEREESNTFKFYYLGLNTFFLLNVSFLLYKINSIYKFVLVESSQLVQFLFFCLVVLLVFSFKTTVNKMLVFFTGERKVVSDYSTSATLINQAFGLLLFPLIILAEFSPFNPLVCICVALIILGMAILLKWYRGLIMGLIEERIGLLQIFSYFCGLEILPVFVLVKYIVETF